MKSFQRKDIGLVLIVAIGLAAVVMLTRSIDERRAETRKQTGEESLYLSPNTAKRLSLAFNGLAADFYWMRTLQYVGRKIVSYEDSHEGNFYLGNLSGLDLQLLPQLLRISTTLDPQFLAPYEYGAVILPEISSDEAIDLLNRGIAANPTAWQLHQHLGYIYWKRDDYQKASEIYAEGSRIPGAPPWMAAMSARMKADGGSRGAAREMYRHLTEASNDEAVKNMVAKQVMRLDSLDERDSIRRMLKQYVAANNRCIANWRELTSVLRASGLRLDENTGAPLDPSGMAYRLIKTGCDVDLDGNSTIPKR